MQTSDNDADVETESVFFAADDDAEGEEEEEEFYHHQNHEEHAQQRNHFRGNDESKKNFFSKNKTTNATMMMITDRALKPRTGRMKTRAAAAAGAGAGGGGRKTSGRKKNTVASRSHARLGVSPVRGRRIGDLCTTTTTTSAAENNSTNNNAAMLLSLSRKKEKKKRTIQQRRERTSKHRYSLGAAFSDGGGGTDDDSIVDRDVRNGNAGRVVTGDATTAMEREDAKRRQLLYKRLDRLKQLPSQSQFAKTQIALVNKCLEMLMQVTVRTNEEEDELAKLLSSVKI